MSSNISLTETNTGRRDSVRERTNKILTESCAIDNLRNIERGLVDGISKNLFIFLESGKAFLIWGHNYTFEEIGPYTDDSASYSLSGPTSWRGGEYNYSYIEVDVDPDKDTLIIHGETEQKLDCQQWRDGEIVKKALTQASLTPKRVTGNKFESEPLCAAGSTN